MMTKVITTHVSLEMADKIDAMANRLERSKAWIVKQALTDWMLAEEERYRLTLEGLDDVDNGQVVEHQVVRDWINNLQNQQAD